VDEITGTRTRGAANNNNNNRHMAAPESTAQRKEREGYPVTVVARPPPDFGKLPVENAIKHAFNVKTGMWKATRVKVKLEAEPFARGGLRKAYHLQDISSNTRTGDSNVTYVAKMSIDPDEDRETYFQDAEMQCFAAEWAKKFNQVSVKQHETCPQLLTRTTQSNAPKKVDFVQAWILELVDRENRDLCAVERFIAGPYRKHNNNFGFVNDDERNTPQAFSHFTYEASGHMILVCDIQGVGDLYTGTEKATISKTEQKNYGFFLIDPQMHTINGNGFGKGNLGVRGFEKFLSTHRCNGKKKNFFFILN